MSTSTPRLGLVKPAAGEAYSLTIINNNNDTIDTYVSGTADKLAKGRSLKTKGTAASGAVSTLSVINNIPTFTFKAGKEYSIVWDFNYYGSATDGFFEMSIATALTTDSASLTTGLTFLNQRTHGVIVGGASFPHHGSVIADATYTVDTTLQIKFTAKLLANTGTVVIMGDASAPALYIIDESGDQI